jgi:transcriptional regulator with XRE-family HTH domain
MPMSESDTSGDERPEHEDPPYVDLTVGPNREQDNQRFGRILAEFRELAGLSRSEAAVRLDISAEYLRLIELGRRSPALGQMRTFIDVYGIQGDVERLQPGGDRPDLILMPPHGDEPMNVEFVSRIREARRRGIDLQPEAEHRREAVRRAEADLPSESRAIELGYIVSLLATADDRTLARVYDLLTNGPAR